jgi:hypothetical protein
MATRAQIEETYNYMDEVWRLSFGDHPDLSCAYFDGDFSKTLEQAQRDKHEFILDALRVGPGARVLDVGCGWGPLLQAIRRRGAHGVGITLSTKQRRGAGLGALRVLPGELQDALLARARRAGGRRVRGLVVRRAAAEQPARAGRVRPRHLCLAASVNGGAVQRPGSRLTCYKAKRARSRGGRLPIANAFANGRFHAVKPGEVCLPGRSPLRMTGAASQGATTALVTFDQPLADAAALPIRFRITPQLAVNSVVLDATKDRVVLVTAAQAPETTYTVTGIAIVSRDGVPLDPAASAASFTTPALLNTGSDEDTAPRVVGAISTGNTGLVVQFSKAMSDSALEGGNYEILQEGVGGRLFIIGLGVFRGTRRETVEFVTTPQSEVRYQLTAVDVTDTAEKPIGPRQVVAGVVIDPRQTTFQGTGPNANEFRDSDRDPVSGASDGLTDGEELRGWFVTVTLANGTTTTRHVTSDRTLRDTDGDGLSDGEEKDLGTDPRDADTDDDRLTDNDDFNVYFSDPLKQDSDGDTLNDGLEVLFFKTSPLFADTDGDQIKDQDEIVLAPRNARVADLPQLGKSVSGLSMDLNVEYSFKEDISTQTTVDDMVTVGLEQARGTKITTGQERSFKQSHEASVKVSQRVKFSPLDLGSTNFEFETKHGFERGTVSKWDRETSTNTQEKYEQVTRSSMVQGATSSVEHAIKGASMKVGVTLENVGSTAFTVRNMLISVLQVDPIDRSRFVPVATLKPPVDDLAVSLGPIGGTSQRGPILFTASSTDPVAPIFPNQIDDLVKHPRGLVFEWANFDISDERGRNFAFTAQEIFEKTAGFGIDFGDGRYINARVATNSTFDATGRPRGLPMRRVFEELLGLKTNDVIRNGPNQRAETAARDDDVQVVPVGAQAGRGEVVVTAGPDGELDSEPGGDDRVGGSGYETRTIDRIVNGRCLEPATDAGARCEQDDDCDGGECSKIPVAILTRILDLESPLRDDRATPAPNTSQVIDEERRFWWVFPSVALDPTTDFDDILVQAGQDYGVRFVEDKDGDGILQNEEDIYGSDDRRPNSDGCVAAGLDATRAGIVADANLAARCPFDSYDTLNDRTEIQEGWLAPLVGKVARRTFSDPTRPDSDGDGLMDDEEEGCGLDPRQRDTDVDGVSDFEEMFGYSILDEAGEPATDVVPYSGVVILDGGDGIPQSIPSGDDGAVNVRRCTGGTRAGQPCNSDTAATPGGCPGAACPNCCVGSVAPGGIVIQPGPIVCPVPPAPCGNAPLTIESQPGGDDFIAAAHPRLTSGQAILDGGDGFVNTLLFNVRGDDQLGGLFGPFVGRFEAILSAGRNGVFESEFSELAGDDFIGPDSLRCWLRGTLGTYATNPLDDDSDADLIADGVEASLSFNPNDPNDGAFVRDDDLDGVPNFFEQDGFDSFVNGQRLRFTSLPNKVDSDEDGLPDALDHMYGSNPRAADTDGDGISDFDEFRVVNDVADTCAPEGVAMPSTDPCVTFQVKRACQSRTRARSGRCAWPDFVALCGSADAPACRVPDLTGSLKRGTSLNERDTDRDGLTDPDELRLGTKPTDPNTDDDNKTDGEECSPTACNRICATGGDGRCRDPLIKDRKATWSWKSLRWVGDCDGGGNCEDIKFFLYIRRPTDSVFTQMLGTSNPSDANVTDVDPSSSSGLCSITVGPGLPFYDAGSQEWRVPDPSGVNTLFLKFTRSAPRSFIVREGETFDVHGYVFENDGGGDRDGNFAFGPNPCDICDQVPNPNLSTSDDFLGQFVNVFTPSATFSINSAAGDTTWSQGISDGGCDDNPIITVIGNLALE